MAKFDSNRILPGTISFTRDATTGEFKIQQQGFLKLPDLSLPTIDQADYDTGNGTTTPPDSDTPTPEKTLPFIPGGDDKPQPMMDVGEVKTFDDIQKQAADFAKQDIGIDRTSIDQGAIQVSGLNEKEAYDKAVASYNAIAERNRELGMGRQTLSTEERLQNKVDLDAARNRMDSARKSFEDTFETIKAAPKIADFSEGPKTVPPETLMGTKTATQFGVPDAIKFGQPAVADKNIFSTAKNLINNSATVKLAATGMKAVGTVAVGVGDALLGVTDVDRRRREADSSAAKSLGLKTVGELGGSTDPGRIAMSPADHVFGGMNRDSAKGNLSEAGAKRVATRMSAKTQARIAELSPERQKAFNDKTKEFQDQLNDFNSQKELEKKEISQNPNLRAGAGGEGGGTSGRVICTDLHRTGELSTKDWIRDTKFTFKQLSKKHVKGYLLWAEPTVKHIQKYPRYRKLWKHFAQHRANDIAWRLNEGKFDLLGRIYAGIGEPLCWLLGNFVSDKQINKYNTSHWRRI